MIDCLFYVIKTHVHASQIKPWVLVNDTQVHLKAYFLIQVSLNFIRQLHKEIKTQSWFRRFLSLLVISVLLLEITSMPWKLVLFIGDLLLYFQIILWNTNLTILSLEYRIYDALYDKNCTSSFFKLFDHLLNFVSFIQCCSKHYRILNTFLYLQTKGKSDNYWIVSIHENPQQLR